MNLINLVVPVATLASFLIFLLLIDRVLVKIVVKNKNKRDRLRLIENISQVANDKGDNLLSKFINKSSSSLYETFLKVSPIGTRERINENLKISGLNKTFTPSMWIWFRLLLGIIFPLLFISLFISFDVVTGKLITILILLMVMINTMLSLIVKIKIKSRKKQIVRDLPDVIDLVTVSVEAGLSFDGAIDRVMKSVDSPVTDEFGIMLKEVRMGKQRKDALREMMKRCDVPDMTTLLGSIIQADDLGVSVTSILRIQSKQLREKRRQRAREQSLKAPIKLLFPILLFIFPTIFVILLAPVLIQMAEIF